MSQMKEPIDESKITYVKIIKEEPVVDWHRILNTVIAGGIGTVLALMLDVLTR